MLFYFEGPGSTLVPAIQIRHIVGEDTVGEAYLYRLRSAIAHLPRDVHFGAIVTTAGRVMLCNDKVIEEVHQPCHSWSPLLASYVQIHHSTHATLRPLLRQDLTLMGLSPHEVT